MQRRSEDRKAPRAACCSALQLAHFTSRADLARCGGADVIAKGPENARRALLGALMTYSQGAVSRGRADRTASAALAAIGGAAAAAASAAAAVAAAAAAAVAEQAPVRIERHTREAAPPRSRRRPPGGHDTGRERGGSGRAPGPSPLLLLLLLLVDPETQDEWHRKEMPKKSRALGPPQAMMKRTFSAPQARKFFAAVLCKKASSTKGMVTPWPSQKVPESTQQKSNHWNVSGADGQPAARAAQE